MEPWRHRATGSGQRAAVIAINGDSSDKQFQQADGPLAIFGKRVRDRDAKTPERQNASQHGRPRPRPHNSQLGLSECYALAVHNYGTVSLNEF